MKIRSAVPENGCLFICGGRKKTKQKKQKKTKKNNNKKTKKTTNNIYKTYTHPPHRRLRK